LTRMPATSGTTSDSCLLRDTKNGTCCSHPPPKLGHPLVTFHLTNIKTTSLLHFSYLHMSHISQPFDPPLFNRFIKLCCIFKSVTSIRNIVHALLLAPSAPVSFTVKHLFSFKRLPVRIYRNAVYPDSCFSDLPQSFPANSGHSTPFRLRTLRSKPAQPIFRSLYIRRYVMRSSDSVIE
jgi:hypothetical protein